jgi:hypothetical protein
MTENVAREFAETAYGKAQAAAGKVTKVWSRPTPPHQRVPRILISISSTSPSRI